jgi:hypothetical protein
MTQLLNETKKMNYKKFVNMNCLSQKKNKMWLLQSGVYQSNEKNIF